MWRTRLNRGHNEKCLRLGAVPVALQDRFPPPSVAVGLSVTFQSAPPRHKGFEMIDSGDYKVRLATHPQMPASVIPTIAHQAKLESPGALQDAYQAIGICTPHQHSCGKRWSYPWQHHETPPRDPSDHPQCPPSTAKGRRAGRNDWETARSGGWATGRTGAGVVHGRG